MQVIYSSETSGDIQTTQCYIPEDGNIHNYPFENLKSYKIMETSIDASKEAGSGSSYKET
jgi:hypothetical protein